MTSRLRISVVVPSYRRPQHLYRCLQGLRSQVMAPHEVIVARRIDDRETAVTIAAFAEAKEAVVGLPGGLPPLHAGRAAATGDVIAFIDDDAVPRPDWLDRIARWMTDQGIGGIGGRDVVHAPGFNAAGEPINGLTSDVGRITHLGRLVGNHHRGNGPARDVEVLKGVNMAFRREALALPAALHGTGAQLHWEVAASLWAVSRGWRLVYDPLLRVDHFPAIRPDGDERVRPPFSAVRDSTYNYAATLLTLRPRLRWRRLLYGILLGGRGDPGMGRAVAALLAGDLEVARRLSPSLIGQLHALVDVTSGHRVEMVRTPVRDRVKVASLP